jgi:hypothetical protein
VRPPARRHAGRQPADDGPGFRNLVGLGLDVREASRRTATLAADYLGLDELGRLEPGRRPTSSCSARETGCASSACSWAGRRSMSRTLEEALEAPDRVA